ncbi:ornithine carbamoyltransferase [Candidatus Aerophobetes bacterium]|nr:ornithine carbamoyltransferase [Candidatus Aerophobetes bacterium]
MKKDLLSIADLSKDEILHLFELSDYLRNLLKRRRLYHPLRGKTLGMLFRKPSTRTRLSFEVGMHQLGGYPIFLSSQDLQLGRGETIEDTGKIFSRYVDAIMMRTFDQEEVVKMAQSSSIPVINGLTDLLHPCQALSDYYTLWKRKIDLETIKFVYVGDGNNVCNSLLLGAAQLGVDIVVSNPEGYDANPKIMEITKKNGNGKIAVQRDPLKAVQEADIVYTDVWTSMGKEPEKKMRQRIFQPYQVNENLLKKAKKDALVMHCLPAHRGEEITSEVMDGSQSIVFEQAENRLHLQKAILVELLS